MLVRAWGGPGPGPLPPAGRDFALGSGSVGRREGTRLRGARAADRNLPRIRHGARSEPHGEGGDGDERKPEPSEDTHSQVTPPLRVKAGSPPRAPHVRLGICAGSICFVKSIVVRTAVRAGVRALRD